MSHLEALKLNKPQRWLSEQIQYVQNLGFTNCVFSSLCDTNKCLTHLLDKCFQDIDQSIFENKVIWWIIHENANNTESGSDNYCLLKEVNSQDLILDGEDAGELQSVQDLLDRVFYCCGHRILEFCCENSWLLYLFQFNFKHCQILIVQLIIFRYNLMNKRNRKLIPNLKIDDTITSKKLMWY